MSTSGKKMRERFGLWLYRSAEPWRVKFWKRFASERGETAQEFVIRTIDDIVRREDPEFDEMLRMAERLKKP